MNKKEIVAELTALGVEFDPTANKGELEELLATHTENAPESPESDEMLSDEADATHEVENEATEATEAQGESADAPETPESFVGVESAALGKHVVVTGRLKHNGEVFEAGTVLETEAFGEYAEALIAAGALKAWSK